ncbi:hypothetical protein QO014_000001, partial [Kaistia dalseonensis]|nr:hypothetical protein [Kaistia dalseonensis]
SQPSLPAGGRAGEGAAGQISVFDDLPPPERGDPLPYPPPFGERGAATARLASAVPVSAADEALSQPSLPAGGRAGEGAAGQISVFDDLPPPERGGPLPYPPPFGERGAATARLASAVPVSTPDEALSQPSLPAGGRAGEGSFGQVSVFDDLPLTDRGGPLPYPPPFGERGAATARLASAGAVSAPDEALSQPSLPEGGRGGEGQFRLATSLGARTSRSASLLVAAPELFAREFGALDRPANPLVGPAIARLRRRDP